MQAREIVKANNLTDQVVVIHGRVEVSLPHYSFLIFSSLCVGNLALLVFHT
jgi:hypothetical protein